MTAKEDLDPSPAAAARSVIRSRQEAVSRRMGELIDLFLKESDQSKWPGDKTPADRGDRFWFKRNAEATGRLAMRAYQLLEPAVGGGAAVMPDEDERAAAREKQIERLNREGIAILDRQKAKRPNW